MNRSPASSAGHGTIHELPARRQGDSYRLRGKDLDARIGAKPPEIA
jgi:hypothetical protein